MGLRDREMSAEAIASEEAYKAASEVAGTAKRSESPEELDKLSEHDHVVVRSEVAQNINTSAETLDKLSSDSSIASVGDEDKLIGELVAENPNTSQETLEKLVESKDTITVSTDVDDSYDKPVTKEAALNSLNKREIEATAGNGENKDMGDLDKADKMAENQKDQGQEQSNNSEVSR